MVTVGTGSTEIYQCKHGYPVKVQLSAGAVSADDFDAVVVARHAG